MFRVWEWVPLDVSRALHKTGSFHPAVAMAWLQYLFSAHSDLFKIPPPAAFDAQLVLLHLLGRRLAVHARQVSDVVFIVSQFL